MDHLDDDQIEPDDGAPICSACGVTGLPDGNDGFQCENPGCEGYGEPL